MKVKMEKKIWKFILRNRIKRLNSMKMEMSIKHDELSDRILRGMTNGGTELDVKKLQFERDKCFRETLKVDNEITDLEMLYYKVGA